MKLTLTASLLALLLGVPVGASLAVAQDEAAPAEVSDAAQERFDALEQEAQDAYDAWVTDIRKRMQEAEEKGEKLPESAFVSPMADFIPQFQEAATEYAGTENAVPFLMWLVSGQREDQDAAKSAITTVFESHLKSPNIKGLTDVLPYLDYFFGEEDAKEMLAKVEREATLPALRAWATYSRLSPILDEAAIDSAEFMAAKREMLALLENVKDRRLKGEVEQQLKIREKFSLGMVAPDIAGIDLDGVEFKLSDYKGNVLFVDFWGDW